MADPLPLADKRIALPESRELDLFVEMLETRGAVVTRCPLVDIRDAPDATPVETWLRGFVEGECDDLVLLTGEGLRRLLGFAERAGGDLRERFVVALGAVRKITRGPKPVRALRAIDLNTDLAARAPTTDGVIATLTERSLHGRVVGVQLYGTDPNEKLIGFLRRAGARPCPVAPYVYADSVEDDRVLALIQSLADNALDAIAFTSAPQVRRLFSVARRHAMETALKASLQGIVVAAVGPVVAAAVRERAISVDLMPETSFFMKPLTRSLVAHFAGEA